MFFLEHVRLSFFPNPFSLTYPTLPWNPRKICPLMTWVQRHFSVFSTACVSDCACWCPYACLLGGTRNAFLLVIGNRKSMESSKFLSTVFIRRKRSYERVLTSDSASPPPRKRKGKHAISRVVPPAGPHLNYSVDLFLNALSETFTRKGEPSAWLWMSAADV